MINRNPAAELVMMLQTLAKNIGKSFDELSERFGVNPNNKSRNNVLVNKMLDEYRGDEFRKLILNTQDITVKTIQTGIDWTPEESMSFPAFDFVELANEDWEHSKTNENFSRYFLFCVFKKCEPNSIYFRKCFLWRMPPEDLESHVKKAWERVKSTLLSGDIVKDIDKGQYNFPGAGEDSVCHIRPHASNAEDTALLPVPDINTGRKRITRQSFWLNKEYIKKIIEEN